VRSCEYHSALNNTSISRRQVAPRSAIHDLICSMFLGQVGPRPYLPVAHVDPQAICVHLDPALTFLYPAGYKGPFSETPKVVIGKIALMVRPHAFWRWTKS